MADQVIPLPGTGLPVYPKYKEIDTNTHAMSVAVEARPGASADGSGTIAAVATSQVVFAAKADRRWLLIQNLSTAEVYINFGAAATTGLGSIKVAAGATFEMNGYAPPESVNIIGGTLGQEFTAKQG